jgi:hypothetical protein
MAGVPTIATTLQTTPAVCLVFQRIMEISSKHLKLIELAQDSLQWHAFIMTIINILIPN